MPVKSSTHPEKLHDRLSRQPNAANRCLEGPRSNNLGVALLYHVDAAVA